MAPLDDALLNGYAGHALDYDDVCSNVRGHPGTLLLPALFGRKGRAWADGTGAMTSI